MMKIKKITWNTKYHLVALFLEDWYGRTLIHLVIHLFILKYVICLQWCITGLRWEPPPSPLWCKQGLANRAHAQFANPWLHSLPLCEFFPPWLTDQTFTDLRGCLLPFQNQRGGPPSKKFVPKLLPIPVSSFCPLINHTNRWWRWWGQFAGLGTADSSSAGGKTVNTFVEHSKFI